MAKKPYGGRWQIVDDKRLGEGGQSEVFRVVDVTGALPEQYALKRVKNPKRQSCFESEIAAISRLSHPNVVRLIDHSALTDKAGLDDRQYLVMPLADGGDLSAPARLSLYQDDIDAVLKVAFQVASALQAAHATNIVHRDVKPQNILFKGIGHETWLTDFGICLLRDLPRNTDDKEIVGPRAFMAPELEEGGRLDVTPAADIYSLGKVIFYMISGGQIVARERLEDERFQSIFAKGERYRLLELLLQRMICPVGSRIQDVASVKTDLDKIQQWERNAIFLPVGKDGLDRIGRFQRRSAAAARVTLENAQNRNHEESTIDRVKTSVLETVAANLFDIAAHLSSATVECRTEDADCNFNVQVGERRMFSPLAGCQLVVEDKGREPGYLHVLQLFVCREGTVTFVPQAAELVRPPVDPVMVLLPVYRGRWIHQPPNLAAALGYLSTPAALGRQVVHMPGLQAASNAEFYTSLVPAAVPQFMEEACQHFQFRASEWPANVKELRTAISDAVDMFVFILDAGPRAYKR